MEPFASFMKDLKRRAQFLNCVLKKAEVGLISEEFNQLIFFPSEN